MICIYSIYIYIDMYLDPPSNIQIDMWRYMFNMFTNVYRYLERLGISVYKLSTVLACVSAICCQAALNSNHFAAHSSHGHVVNPRILRVLEPQRQEGMQLNPSEGGPLWSVWWSCGYSSWPKNCRTKSNNAWPSALIQRYKFRVGRLLANGGTQPPCGTWHRHRWWPQPATIYCAYSSVDMIREGKV